MDDPERLIRHSAYWYSVRSRRRNQLWKGFVQVDLAPSEGRHRRGDAREHFAHWRAPVNRGEYHQPVTIKVMVTRVGSGRPRYLLIEAPSRA